ncbi:MAG: FemAB family XrtA/PEP-CTERM system-associated protein [Candidatus Acidiferrales bacterium]
MKIVVASEQHAQKWNEFVIQHPAAVNYIRWEWKQVMERAFQWQTFYVMAEDSGEVRGVLPLVWQKSRLFGNLLTSMPYFSEGGVLAAEPEAEALLISEAISLAKKLKSKSMQFRQTSELKTDIPVKTDRVAMVLDIDPDPEVILRSFDTKMRSNVRRSCKTGLEAEFGGIEFLDDFYQIFAHRMRDLGTPVYSKKFFEQILKVFPTETFICRVRTTEKIVGASFMTGFRNSIESNWAAALPEGKNLKASMFMAWRSMCYVATKGYTIFDFGRSSIGSPTHKFKLEWNCRTVPLFWYHWSAAPQKATELDRRNPTFSAAINAWKKLPLGISKVLGPPIAKCIP